MQLLCHTEPKFACTHCGKKFYHQATYNKHWPNCELKKYACDICGHRSKHLNIIKRHKRLEHPDTVSEEKTTISPQDDPGQPTVNLSTKVEVSDALEENENDHEEACSSRQSSTQGKHSNNYEVFESLGDSRPIEHSLASENDDDDTDSHMAEKESRMRSFATLNDSCEAQVGLGKISQPLVENASVQQFRCSLCDKTFSEFFLIRQHMVCCLN